MRRGGAAAVTAARRRLVAEAPVRPQEGAAEGGCGVLGLASEVPVAGRHLLRALSQMRNRGNGKGGGVAMVGLDPEQLGVSPEVLREDYLVGVAYLDSGVRSEVEERFIAPVFEVDAVRPFAPAAGADRSLFGLEVEPPQVVAYFARPREEAVEELLERGDLAREDFPDRRALADEVVYQSSFRLNRELYAGERGNLAYVQCHGKDLLVLKMVGYAEDVIRYYGLEDRTAHVWIGHHRYPTKGKVWHPGGAHPFVGLNEALVHNGDFANYQSICDYLAQRGIRPLFSTDTEVAALVYDLHRRTYRYPLEYVIESLAPTTERDFTLLSRDRQRAYRAIQEAHIHGSPDGPWFFILAESDRGTQRLVGITDTSMLRPQVFALQRGEVGIALCGSEKQVIDAAMESLAGEDTRFWRRPDHLWAARGGSHTDGGAFVFTLEPGPDGARTLTVTDKFGKRVEVPGDGDASAPVLAGTDPASGTPEIWNRQAVHDRALGKLRRRLSDAGDPLPEPGAWEPGAAFAAAREALEHPWGWTEAAAWLNDLRREAAAGRRRQVLDLLTLLTDRRYPAGGLRRSRWLAHLDDCLEGLVADTEEAPCPAFRVQSSPGARPEPEAPEATLILDARRYPVEGEGSAALEVVALYRLGWRRFMVTRTRGHRFLGCGLGAGADGVEIDVYGSPGDYLGSGGDGVTVRVHGDAQDQVAQILRRGTLIVHGDVGQAFGYGAKGGEAYVLGSAAGRPMINAVGRPRVVVNGTCLDYLGESFMAGDPLTGGGFVVVNAVAVGPDGTLTELPTPYPGGNLFSLASGGALYVRDPHRRLDSGQLNGAEFAELGDDDWAVIEPYLKANEAHFGIPVERLLTAGGEALPPQRVYRKIRPVKHQALHAEQAWVTGPRRRR